MALRANNVTLSNISLTSQNTSASPKHTTIEFDVTWDNSWRTSVSWDAVWVFAKFRIGTGDWKHASLSLDSTHHSITTNNGVNGKVRVAPRSYSSSTSLNMNLRGAGAYLYRRNIGTGTVNWQDVRLRWNYGYDAVGDTDDIAIRLFAIEMVYVPTGPFYAGDGDSTLNNSGSTYSWLKSSANNQPAFIISANTGSVYDPTGYSTNFSTYTSGGYSWPNGYKGYYCMKYEMTQQQYVDFFNCLNQTGRSNNWVASSSVPQNVITTVDSVGRNFVTWTGVTDAYIRSNKGGDRAMTWLNTQIAMNYLDWACLRPMTELEYEKACRGVNVKPVRYEYAWGTAFLSSTTTNTAPANSSMINDGTSSEQCSTANVNANIGLNSSPTSSSTTNGNNIGQGTIGNASTGSQFFGAYGPMRVGNFARSGTSRVQSGASYYGIMDLTGNALEWTIAFGRSTRSSSPQTTTYWYSTFRDSTTGDGMLNTSSNTDNYSAIASGNIQQFGWMAKGGSWNIQYTNPQFFRISSRWPTGQFSTNSWSSGYQYNCSSTQPSYENWYNNRDSNTRCYGIRGVRTADFSGSAKNDN